MLGYTHIIVQKIYYVFSCLRISYGYQYNNRYDNKYYESRFEFFVEFTRDPFTHIFDF